MLVAAIEQERLHLAERLLSEIERRHGLPHASHSDIHRDIIDRFLAAYLPEARDGELAPQALEYAFTPTLTDAIELLRQVVDESPAGYGSAVYVHDLDTGSANAGERLH